MASEPEPGPAAKVLVGLFFLALGVIAFICAGNSGDPEGKVMCGDDEMAPGDTCITWVNGSATSRSYDEQADQNDSMFDPVVSVIGGLVSIVIGIAGLTGLGSDRNESIARNTSDWRSSDSPVTRMLAAPPRRTAAAQSQVEREPDRSSGEKGETVVMSGEDVEVEIDGAGITVRTGPRAMNGPGDRVPLRRMDWHEVIALEFDQGLTGMRLSLCAVVRYGKKIPIADTWAFEMPELSRMAETIKRLSGGMTRLR